MATQYTDRFTSQNIPISVPSLAVYPLIDFMTLSWPGDPTGYNVAFNIILSGTNSNSPALYLPKAVDGSLGTNFYITNLNTATVTGDVYSSPQGINVYTWNGGFIGRLVANGTLSIILSNQSLTEELDNWTLSYMTIPSASLVNLTTFIQLSSGKGVNGLGLNSSGYVCQQQNVIIDPNDSGVIGDLNITILNGNDVYVFTKNPYNNINLPQSVIANDYEGKVITFKNSTSQSMTIKAPETGNYYIDVNIFHAANTETQTYGNQSIVLYPNESITLGYIGPVIIDSITYMMYVVLCDTRSYSSMYKTYRYELPVTPNTQVTPIIIDDSSALVSDVIEFDVPPLATDGIYYVSLQSNISKIYYISFLSNDTQDNSLVFAVKSDWANSITISRTNRLLGFFINSEGLIVYTSFSSAEITYATAGDINFVTQTGAIDKAISASLFVSLLTDVTDITGARSYPNYLINNILGDVIGAMKYKGGYDASGGVPPLNPQKGFWWIINGAGTFTPYSGGTPITVVAGDWLLCLGLTPNISYIVLNQKRFSLFKTVSLPTTNTAYTITSADIGKSIEFTASVGNNNAFIFPQPSTLNLPTTNMSDFLEATKTIIYFNPAGVASVFYIYLLNNDSGTYNVYSIPTNHFMKIEVQTSGANWYINYGPIGADSFYATYTNGSNMHGDSFGRLIHIQAGATVTISDFVPLYIPSGVGAYVYQTLNEPCRIVCDGAASIVSGATTLPVSGVQGNVLEMNYNNGKVYFIGATL